MSRMKRMAEAQAQWPGEHGRDTRLPAESVHAWRLQNSRDADFYADGTTYDPEQDKARLGKQALWVWNMLTLKGPDEDRFWWTTSQMREAGVPGSETGISARIRDFRKARFGSHTVERRRRKDGRGTWEYRLRVNGDDN